MFFFRVLNERTSFSDAFNYLCELDLYSSSWPSGMFYYRTDYCYVLQVNRSNFRAWSLFFWSQSIFHYVYTLCLPFTNRLWWARKFFFKKFERTFIITYHLQKIVLKICADPIRRQIFTTAYGNNVTCSMIENLYYNLNLCNSSDFPVSNLSSLMTTIPSANHFTNSQGCLKHTFKLA